MFNSPADPPIRFPATQKPMLLVTVDTEEEFDWSKPHDSANTRVTHIPAQERAQAVFARFGIKPTYFVDYPVAAQPQAYEPLRDWAKRGQCEIGAHLHPWVNPPIEERVCNRHSYPGNLEAGLERRKLALLTELIERNFGRRPTVYRAGRYGAGPNTAAILEALGYEIDSSVVPRTDLSRDEGPDFSAFGFDPYWFGTTRKLLEIPVGLGWTGLLSAAGPFWQRLSQSGWGRACRLPGVLARARLFDRIKLTPEGIELPDLCRVSEAMYAAGYRVFNLMYHSPSLAPGHTPYVRNEAELDQFVRRIEGYCEFFFGRLGGIAATPDDVRSLCLALGRKSAA